MATNTAIATSPKEKYKTVFEMLNRANVVKQISLALPKHLSAERMIRVALSAIQKTPKLLECDERSLVGAIIEASQLGLEPNGILGEGYLIPRKNKKTHRLEATFMPGYKGLAKLARNSGEISTIYGEVVKAADKFEVRYGTAKELIHEPALDLSEKDRGAFRGAYAVVKYKDGETDFVYLSKAEVDKVRARSQSPNEGPWVTDYEPMAVKSAIRRLAKFMPLTSEDKRFRQAISHDEGIDLGEAGFIEMGPEPEPIDITPIDESQRMAIFKLKEDSRCPDSKLTEILSSFGFEISAEVTQGEYDDVCKAIRTWDKGPGQGTNGDVDGSAQARDASLGAPEPAQAADSPSGEEKGQESPESRSEGGAGLSGPIDDLVGKQRSGLLDAFQALGDLKGMNVAKDTLEAISGTRVPAKVKEKDLGLAIAELNRKRMEK